MSVLAGLGLGASVLGGLLNTGTSIANTNKTIQANKDLAKYAYDRDLEMWNATNAYNSPTAQMQRLQDAGLNPNLVYGTGAVGNTSAPPPKYNVPESDYKYQGDIGIAQGISMYQDFSVKQAQVDNLKAQNDLIIQQAVTEGVRASELGTKNARNEFELNLAKELRETSLETAKSNLRNLQLDTTLKTQKSEMYPLERKSLEESIKQSQFETGNRGFGVRGNDPILARIIARLLNELGFTSFGDFIPSSMRFFK